MTTVEDENYVRRSLGLPVGNQPERAAHLAWCKERALEYVGQGDVQGAFASMASDLTKHPDTQGHEALGLGAMLMVAGLLSTPSQMREFIEGFG